MNVTYLDYNASAPFPKELFREIEPIFLRSFSNPSSMHSEGRASRKRIYDAADIISHFIEAEPENIYWTSSGSEANAWVFHSIAAMTEKDFHRKPRFLISSIEHESVLLNAKRLGDVHFIPVTSDGVISLEYFQKILEDHRFDLVSIMAINSETGVIQPVDKVNEICLEKKIPLHIDCVQALGKLLISFKKWDASYLTFSGHKLGAPKGVGFLLTQNKLFPLMSGRQQKGLRGGTENSFGISMLGKIINYHMDHPLFPEQLKSWHQDFEKILKEKIPGTIIHGEKAPRVGNTSFIGFTETDSDGIVMNLDLEGVCASSGSACSSGSIDPSHVLMAMGCDKAMARSSVRFSSGCDTQWSDFEKVINMLPNIVQRVRSSRKFGVL